MNAITIGELQTMGLSDSAISIDTKRYLICPGVRIMFHACVGGWDVPELWVGNKHVVKGPTAMEVKNLVQALRIEF